MLGLNIIVDGRQMLVCAMQRDQAKTPPVQQTLSEEHPCHEASAPMSTMHRCCWDMACALLTQEASAVGHRVPAPLGAKRRRR
jgi:hypothetical protein